MVKSSNKESSQGFQDHDSTDEEISSTDSVEEEVRHERRVPKRPVMFWAFAVLATGWLIFLALIAFAGF